MSAHFDAFRRTFREVHSTCAKLVHKGLGPRDRHLKGLMDFVLAYQTASEYPFVFKYSFARSEAEAAKITKLAAAIHLLQTSAFVTDDILDRTEMRYGHPAVHEKYGVSYAIIATEILQSVALETISEELDKGKFQNKCLALKILNQMMRELYVGQYLDVYNTGNLRVSKRDYYRVIALGVGNFFKYIAESAALLAGRPEREVKGLSSFAYHYGMALFITDDIVDVVDRPEVTGKAYAADLQNRRMRLPMMLALEMSGRGDVRFLKRLMKGGEPSPARIRRAADIIRRSGALDACLRAVKRHLSESLASLSSMGASLGAERLRWLSETLLTSQRLDG